MSALMGPIEAGFRQRIVEARGRMARVVGETQRIAELEAQVRRLKMELIDRESEIKRLGAIPRGNARRIIEEVCDQHQVTPNGLRSPRRDRDLVTARHEVCYRLRHELDLSLPAIGRLVGNRDHTTVLHSIKQHQASLDKAAFRAAMIAAGESA